MSDKIDTYTVPWKSTEYYRVNGMQMVYEEFNLGGNLQDLIIDFDGRRWTVEELQIRGYSIDKPRMRRKFYGLRKAA